MWLWQRIRFNRLVFPFSPPSWSDDNLIPTKFSCVVHLCFSISFSLTYFISIPLNTASSSFLTTPFSAWPRDAPQAPHSLRQLSSSSARWLIAFCWCAGHLGGREPLPLHRTQGRHSASVAWAGREMEEEEKRKGNQGYDREMTERSKMRGNLDGKKAKNKFRRERKGEEKNKREGRRERGEHTEKTIKGREWRWGWVKGGWRGGRAEWSNWANWGSSERQREPLEGKMERKGK